MIRVLSFLLLTILGFTAPWWLFVIGLVLYGYRYAGFEILLLAFLVDALFMSVTGVIPYYTIGTVFCLIVFELVKPHFVLYNQK